MRPLVRITARLLTVALYHARLLDPYDPKEIR